jgi:hypothetical protein
LDQSTFARGTNVTVLSNSVMLDEGEGGIALFTLPGLGVLRAHCGGGLGATHIEWSNTTSAGIDAWINSYPADAGASGVDNRLVPYHVAPDDSWYVASHTVGSAQKGDTLVLGGATGTTATVTLGAFTSAGGTRCRAQATATVWAGR